MLRAPLANAANGKIVGKTNPKEVRIIKRMTSISAVIIVIVAMLVGGGLYAQIPSSPKTFDIGVATPLTGPAAHIGMNMKNAVLMSIEDQNALGGVRIAGEKYLLNPIILDTKKDAAVGKAGAEQLVYDKKVKVIVGPFIDDSIGAQSVTEPNKIIAFFITPSTPNMTGPSKPYSFFVNGLLPELFSVGAAYIEKFYPKAKKVVTMVPDLPDAGLFMNSSQNSKSDMEVLK